MHFGRDRRKKFADGFKLLFGSFKAFADLAAVNPDPGLLNTSETELPKVHSTRKSELPPRALVRIFQ